MLIELNNMKKRKRFYEIINNCLRTCMICFYYCVSVIFFSPVRSRVRVGQNICDSLLRITNVQGAILFSKLTFSSLHPSTPTPRESRVHYRRGYRLFLDEGWIPLSLRQRFWQQVRRKFDR